MANEKMLCGLEKNPLGVQIWAEVRMLGTPDLYVTARLTMVFK